jgi:hypothetical protein
MPTEKNGSVPDTKAGNAGMPIKNSLHREGITHTDASASKRSGALRSLLRIANSRMVLKRQYESSGKEGITIDIRQDQPVVALSKKQASAIGIAASVVLATMMGAITASSSSAAMLVGDEIVKIAALKRNYPPAEISMYISASQNYIRRLGAIGAGSIAGLLTFEIGAIATIATVFIASHISRKHAENNST